VIDEAEGQVSQADWWKLTSLPRTQQMYSLDCYFRESWADAEATLGMAAFEWLQRATSLILRPEALLDFALVTKALGVLRLNGVFPVVRRLLQLNRQAVRELWRFQWDGATLARISLVSQSFEHHPALWLVAAETSPVLQLPTTVRVNALKGARDPNGRDPNSLRGILNAPNATMTGVHVSDEPADIVREIGILFDKQERSSIFTTLGDWFAQSSGERNGDVGVVDIESDLAAETRPSDDEGRNREALLRLILEASETKGDMDDHVCQLPDTGYAGWLEGRGDIA
jgi:hypothetical protein